MSNQSCEITFTTFNIDAYAMTRVLKLSSSNIWLLSSKINIWRGIILVSQILKCFNLNIYLKTFLKYLRRVRAIYFQQMAKLFIPLLLISRRWRNPTSSYIVIPDMLFFKDLKYFDPGAIFRKHKAHFLTNIDRKPMFVSLSSINMINDRTCIWPNESIDFTRRGAVLDS
jgi:hypothetical protein